MKPIPPNLTRAAILGTMAAIMFACSAIAHAATPNISSHKGKTGTLQITTPTEVSGVLLEPGKYEVKPRKSPGGTVIEFARWNENPYAQEALPVWTREVVASIPATPQVLSFVPLATELLLASDNDAKATGLQIRGDSAEYGL
jgi:hypothetical protein